MQITVNLRDAVLLSSLADYLESTPDKVAHGIFEFFVQKGAALATLGDAVARAEPDREKVA
jgi:hypothetical protein